MGLTNWARWARGVGLDKLGEMGWVRWVQLDGMGGQEGLGWTYLEFNQNKILGYKQAADTCPRS